MTCTPSHFARNLARTLSILGLLAAFGLLFPGLGTVDPAAAQGVTVSGTVRYQGQPVGDVSIVIVWDGGARELVTSADGTFRAQDVSSGGWVNIHVRPNPEQRLAYRNWRIEPVTGDVVKDFDLQSGYRLSGEIRQPDGSPYTHGMWLGMVGAETSPPENEWTGDGLREDGRFDMVLVPDVYTFGYEPTLRPLALPETPIDLRSGDVTGLVVTLQTALQAEGIPTDPPRADLIQVSAPDVDGYATISGSAGAVPGSARVLVGNVSAHVFETTTAEPDGSFATQLFAPPGSYVLVKYGSGRFNEVIRGFGDAAQNAVVEGDDVNELPGTMLQVGGAPLGGHTFDSVGGFFAESATPAWAGWRFSGTLQGATSQGGYGLPVQPGQQLRLTGQLRVTSPALNCGGDLPEPMLAHVHLQYVFDAEGRNLPWSIWFNAYLFTPTGLPIEHEASGESVPVITAEFHSPTCVSEHSFDIFTDTTFQIPADVPAGVYRLVADLPKQGGLPLTEDVKQMVIWYAGDPHLELPLVVVGGPITPRIPWTLFGDYPVNGHRGIAAREDIGQFTMVTRVVTPPYQVVIPRLDARSGQAITYRLDPGSSWLSSTDRRQANAPFVPLALPSGNLTIQVMKPDGSMDQLGPAPIRQTSVRTPSTPGGGPIDHGTGHIGDLFHLTTMDETFQYQFDQYGPHVITLFGTVDDIYGNNYPISGTYDVFVAQLLDLDPGQLPTTPYMQGDFFAPGLHVFPAVPARVSITVTHLPYSDPTRAITKTFEGRANRFGYFQPPPGETFAFELPGEFRVDISASYRQPDGTLWAGTMTWGSVVEATNARIEAHGRRGMDYQEGPIDDMPAWFEVFNLPPEKVGIENYYPYFSGDVHWGNEDQGPGDSIHSIITVKDKTPDQMIYSIMQQYISRARNEMRWPPQPFGDRAAALAQRQAIGEAPLFITTSTGLDAAVFPSQIDLWGYWYGSSERPDVHVREIISEDGMGTAYWRFDDTYGYQIGESAIGDLPGDLKWEFGGAVFRVPAQNINEYAIYSSLWVLLPHNDPIGARVTPPFQDATGASINGGPIMILNGEDIDMLFLPKGVRPGDVLHTGDTIAFSGHVGPPLDSQVSVTITAPSGATTSRTWHANKIGWLYDPTFDFVANETGRWTVDVAVLHDRPYVGNGVIPMSHNTGTVLGTSGRYEFYVVSPDSPTLPITSPAPGVITWPQGRVEPLTFNGTAPAGTTALYYTVHDKGVVVDQGTITAGADGTFSLTYDARALNAIFPFVSLTAHEGNWEGLSDEVEINLLAVGGTGPQAVAITLIGEEIHIGSGN